MSKVFYPSNEAWKVAVKHLVERGELTVEAANQVYARIDSKKVESERRSK